MQLTTEKLREMLERLPPFPDCGPLTLIFGVRMWRWEREHIGLFAWSDEDLEKAKPEGFIGERNGVRCYLPIYMQDD